jgi:5-methylcytosine-specific restriction endonuclease McrA
VRKLKKPTLDAAAVFCTCISRVRNANLRKQLRAVARRVAASATRYERAGAQRALHTLSQHSRVGNAVTSEQMCAVYDNRMARRGSVGRPIYDQLQAAAPQGRCPLCAQRTVSTLDHHLPKTLFPSLAVAPINLVPACLECNKAKHDSVPRSALEQTLHPYFDDVDGEGWLVALVNEPSPATLTFFVTRCPSWDDVTNARVRTHFRTFALAELYASHAAEELLNIRFQLQRLSDAGGEASVRAHLTEQAQSRAANQLNSWQTATYRALAASDWYCRGGFA